MKTNVVYTADEVLEALMAIPFPNPRKKLVYIAGPYGRRINNSDAQCEANVKEVIKAARHLIILGHIPFPANIYHFVHSGWLASPTEDVWLEICMAWIPFCDTLLRLPGKSHGADAEVKLAESLGIPVAYSFTELGDITQKYP